MLLRKVSTLEMVKNNKKTEIPSKGSCSCGLMNHLKIARPSPPRTRDPGAWQLVTAAGNVPARRPVGSAFWIPLKFRSVAFCRGSKPNV